MALSFVTAGTINFGATQAAPGTVAGLQVGDHVFLVIGNRASTVTPTDVDGDPSPWVTVDTFAGGTSGDQVRSSIWYARVPPSGTLTLPTLGTSGSASVIGAGIIVARTGATEDIAYAFARISDMSFATSFGGAADRALGFAVGDLITGHLVTNDNVLFSNGAFSASGVTFGSLTERADNSSSLGDDLGMATYTAAVTAITGAAATGNVTPTFTATGAGSVAGAAHVLRLRAVTVAPAAPTVNAGADVTVGPGETFARTATEQANNAAITARSWTIVSGPTGVGTQIGTTAALSWTNPGTLGAYVLRYSAANSIGTGTDDVTVTVAETPPLWSADNESGAVADYYETSNPGDYQAPNESVITTAFARLGTRSLRSTINGVGGGQQRAERVPDNVPNFTEGQEWWFGWSIYLAPGFPVNNGWQVLAQWHSESDTTPPFELDVEDGRLSLSGGDFTTSMIRQDLGPATTGQWIDLLARVVFSSNPAVGEIDFWRDRVQLLTTFNPPGGTLYPNFTSYLKFGIYRNETLTSFPATVYNDQWAIGTTRASVELPAPADERTGAGSSVALRLDEAGTGTAHRRGTGSGGLALVAAGTGEAHRSGIGTAPLRLESSGSGEKRTDGAASSALTLDAAGFGSRGADGAGDAATALTAAGTGQKHATGSGRAGLLLDAAGVGTTTRYGTAPPVHLDAAGSGRKHARGTGRADLGLAANSHGARTGRGQGAAALTVSAGSSGYRTGRGGGTAPLTLAGAGDGGPTAHVGDGAVPLHLDATGGGHRSSSGSGAAALRLDEAGTGARTASGTGNVGALLGMRGTGTRAATGTGTAGLVLDAEALTGPRGIAGHGTATVHLGATGTGARTATGAGTARLRLGATGTGARAAAGRGTAALGLPTDGGGTRRSDGRGDIAVQLDEAGTGQKATTGHGASAVELDGIGAGDRTSTGRGAAALHLADPTGVGYRVAVGAGVADLDVQAAGSGHPVRVGGGLAELTLTASGRGGPTTRRGTGRALLRLGARGGARRTVTGRGRAGLVLGARQRRRVPGHLTPSATTGALTASATVSRLEASA